MNGSFLVFFCFNVICFRCSKLFVSFSFLFLIFNIFFLLRFGSISGKRIADRLNKEKFRFVINLVHLEKVKKADGHNNNWFGNIFPISNQLLAPSLSSDRKQIIFFINAQIKSTFMKIRFREERKQNHFLLGYMVDKVILTHK